MTENERLREELARAIRERNEAREEARRLALENDLLRAELAAMGCGDE